MVGRVYDLHLCEPRWWTAIGPIVMTYFLLNVSGVPMLERKMADRRPEYAEYIRRTSSFIPWPPRR